MSYLFKLRHCQRCAKISTFNFSRAAYKNMNQSIVTFEIKNFDNLLAHMWIKILISLNSADKYAFIEEAKLFTNMLKEMKKNPVQPAADIFKFELDQDKKSWQDILEEQRKINGREKKVLFSRNVFLLLF